MTNENEYSDLQFKNIVTEILEERHLKYKINGEQLYGCCPFHDDNKPSFGVQLKDGLFNCFTCGAHGDIATFVARCKEISRDEAMKLLDYPDFAVDYRYTLEDYAYEKRLNVEKLKNWRIKNSTKGIEIPYFDEKMIYLGSRYRHSPNEKIRFSTDKGFKNTLYGLEFLPRFPEEYVILVEGESDCHCAWSNDIIALGVPRSRKPKERTHKIS